MDQTDDPSSRDGKSSSGAGSLCYIVLEIFLLTENVRVRFAPRPPSSAKIFVKVLPCLHVGWARILGKVAEWNLVKIFSLHSFTAVILFIVNSERESNMQCFRILCNNACHLMRVGQTVIPWCISAFQHWASVGCVVAAKQGGWAHIWTQLARWGMGCFDVYHETLCCIYYCGVQCTWFWDDSCSSDYPVDSSPKHEWIQFSGGIVGYLWYS